MLGPLLPLLALIAAAPDAVDPSDAADWAGTQWAQLSIHERIVIRLSGGTPAPRAARPSPPAADPLAMRWKEKKGDRCVPMADVAGALIAAPGSVDLLMISGKRMRAMLDAECPTLDYYFGLYLHATTDGKICADRDAIRSRSGAICPIHQFRRLEPQH